MRGGRKYCPYVFTEQSVSMLSSVLHSKIAINMSISIINTFVNLRKYISITLINDQDICNMIITKINDITRMITH